MLFWFTSRFVLLLPSQAPLNAVSHKLKCFKESFWLTQFCLCQTEPPAYVLSHLCVPSLDIFSYARSSTREVHGNSMFTGLTKLKSAKCSRDLVSTFSPYQVQALLLCLLSWHLCSRSQKELFCPLFFSPTALIWTADVYTRVSVAFCCTTSNYYNSCSVAEKLTVYSCGRGFLAASFWTLRALSNGEVLNSFFSHSGRSDQFHH